MIPRAPVCTVVGNCRAWPSAMQMAFYLCNDHDCRNVWAVPCDGHPRAPGVSCGPSAPWDATLVLRRNAALTGCAVSTGVCNPEDKLMIYLTVLGMLLCCICIMFAVAYTTFP